MATENNKEVIEEQVVTPETQSAPENIQATAAETVEQPAEIAADTVDPSQASATEPESISTDDIKKMANTVAGLNAEEQAHEDALQALNDFNLDDHMKMMMVLKEAHKRGELSAYFAELYNEEAKKKSKDPLAAIADFTNPKHKAEVVATYGDIWKEVEDRIQTRIKNDEWTKDLVESSGMTAEQYGQMPEQFRQTMAITAEYESDFPSKDMPSLGERLRASKDVLIEGLTSDTGRKALNYVSWGVSIATGGVATKLAVMGIKEVVGAISKNESFVNFTKSAMETGISTLEKLGVPTELISKGYSEMKERTRSVWDNKYMKFGAAALGVVAVGLIMQEVDFDSIAKSAEPVFGSGAAIGSNLIEGGGHAVDLGATVAKEVGSAAVDATANLGNTIASAAVKATDAVAELAGDAKHELGEQLQAAASALQGAGDSLTADAGIFDREADVHADDIFDQETPDEAVTEPPAPAVAATEPTQAATLPASSSTVMIEKGDTLWDIAKSQLEASGGQVTNQNIDATWKAIYEANKETLGDNPHKIFPGQAIKIDPGMLHGVEAPQVASDVSAATVNVVHPGDGAVPAVGPEHYQTKTYGEFQRDLNADSLKMAETMNETTALFEARERDLAYRATLSADEIAVWDALNAKTAEFVQSLEDHGGVAIGNDGTQGTGTASRAMPTADDFGGLETAKDKNTFLKGITIKESKFENVGIEP